MRWPWQSKTPKVDAILARNVAAAKVRRELDARVLAWVEENPGADSEDVAHHFALTLWEADDAVLRLLEGGQLDYT